MGTWHSCAGLAKESGQKSSEGESTWLQCYGHPDSKVLEGGH